MSEVIRDILYFVLSCLFSCFVWSITGQLINIVVVIVTGYSTKIYSVYCTTVNVADWLFRSRYAPKIILHLILITKLVHGWTRLSDVYENIMKVWNFKLCSCTYLASTVCFISTQTIFKVKTEKPKTEKIRGIQGLTHVVCVPLSKTYGTARKLDVVFRSQHNLSRAGFSLLLVLYHSEFSNPPLATDSPTKLLTMTWTFPNHPTKNVPVTFCRHLIFPQFAAIGMAHGRIARRCLVLHRMNLTLLALDYSPSDRPDCQKNSLRFTKIKFQEKK